MKTFISDGDAGIESLRVVEQDAPRPGRGQAVVRVKAASLNYRDLIMVQNPRQRRPYVPLSDGAGEVVAVGEGVTRVQPGDRVAATFFQNWIAGDITSAVHESALGGAIDGVLTEELVVSAEGLVKLPDYLTFEEAATLPCAALTVWNALFETGRLTAGQTVLALGTGGVSIFTLQFTKLVGARVIITSSSDEKLERARQLGADATINYKSVPDWDKAVWELTGKKGVDHVVEVGGAGTMERSIRATRYGGTVSAVGVLSGFEGRIEPFLIVGRSQHVNGIYVGSRDMFEHMNAALAQNQLHPVIDHVFPFEETQDAFEYLKSGSHFGKIVIKIS